MHTCLSSEHVSTYLLVSANRVIHDMNVHIPSEILFRIFSKCRTTHWGVFSVLTQEKKKKLTTVIYSSSLHAKPQYVEQDFFFQFRSYSFSDMKKYKNVQLKYILTLETFNCASSSPLWEKTSLFFSKEKQNFVSSPGFIKHLFCCCCCFFFPKIATFYFSYFQNSKTFLWFQKLKVVVPTSRDLKSCAWTIVATSQSESPGLWKEFRLVQ